MTFRLINLPSILADLASALDVFNGLIKLPAIACFTNTMGLVSRTLSNGLVPLFVSALIFLPAFIVSHLYKDHSSDIPHKCLVEATSTFAFWFSFIHPVTSAYLLSVFDCEDRLQEANDGSWSRLDMRVSCSGNSEYNVAMVISSIFTVIWVFGAPLAAIAAILGLKIPQIVAQKRLDALFQQFFYLYMTKARFQDVDTKGVQPGQVLYDLTYAQLLAMFHCMEDTLNSKNANDFFISVFGDMSEEQLQMEFQKLDNNGSGTLDMAEVQKFLKSRGHVGKGKLLVNDAHSRRPHNRNKIEMSTINMALAAAPWQEHPQGQNRPQFELSSHDEEAAELEIDFEQFKQLVLTSKKSEPLTRAAFRPWVVRFSNGSVHRYTDAQIRQKFGVNEVFPNTTVQHACSQRAWHLACKNVGPS